VSQNKAEIEALMAKIIDIEKKPGNINEQEKLDLRERKSKLAQSRSNLRKAQDALRKALKKTDLKQ
jgi:hypothetical protein